MNEKNDKRYEIYVENPAGKWKRNYYTMYEYIPIIQVVWFLFCCAVRTNARWMTWFRWTYSLSLSFPFSLSVSPSLYLSLSLSLTSATMWLKTWQTNNKYIVIYNMKTRTLHEWLIYRVIRILKTENSIPSRSTITTTNNIILFCVYWMNVCWSNENGKILEV